MRWRWILAFACVIAVAQAFGITAQATSRPWLMTEIPAAARVAVQTPPPDKATSEQGTTMNSGQPLSIGGEGGWQPYAAESTGFPWIAGGWLDIGGEVWQLDIHAARASSTRAEEAISPTPGLALSSTLSEIHTALDVAAIRHFYVSAAVSPYLLAGLAFVRSATTHDTRRTALSADGSATTVHEHVRGVTYGAVPAGGAGVDVRVTKSIFMRAQWRFDWGKFIDVAAGIGVQLRR